MSQTTDNFYRRFSRLALANIISNLLVPLAGLFDIAFLGHLEDIRHLAGVSLATVLFSYIYWTFGFLRMGTTGMTAQAVGRGEPGEVLLAGLRNGLIALVVGILILLLQQPLRELGFTLLQATPEVKASGRAYYNALIWAAPATLLNFVLMGWFLGREQGGKVIVLSAINNGTNVALNYLFIVRYGWASAGAGGASGISQYLMLLVGAVLVFQAVEMKQVRALYPKLLAPNALKACFAFNRDILIRTFALVSTFSLFTNFSSALGTVMLATNTLILQIVTLAAYFIDGIAFATESFAGIFRGQGDESKLRLLLRTAGGSSLIIGVVVALVFNLFAQPLFGLLTSHGDVVERIDQYVVWLLPMLSFGSLSYVLDGYFLGLTEGKLLRRAMVASVLIGFIPLAVLAWWLQSPHLLWLSLSVFMAARMVSLGLYLPKTFKGNNLSQWVDVVSGRKQ